MNKALVRLNQHLGTKNKALVRLNQHPGKTNKVLVRLDKPLCLESKLH